MAQEAASIWQLATSDDPLSPNDKTLRCGADEEKWIASHEGKDLIVARIQNGDIAWVNHFRGDNSVTVLGPCRSERDDVILAYIPQGPKERVAVSGNGDVARHSRHSGIRNMARRTPQRKRSGPLHYHRRKPYATDFNATNQGIRCRWTRSSRHHRRSDA